MTRNAEWMMALDQDEGEFWFPPGAFEFTMSTALLAIHTSRGVVMASDGRKLSSRPGEVLRDDVQKIFPIQPSDKACLAFGLAGTVRLGHGSDISVDFEAETQRETSRLNGDLPKDWWRYLTELKDSLTDAVNARRRPLKEPAATNILIAGRYGKHLKSAHLVFSHGISETEADIFTHPPGQNAKFCSNAILRLIDEPDSHFAKYAEPKGAAVRTIQEAVARALADIRAHYDEEAIKVDAEHCAAIGGRIQIATIDFADGFKWVPGYEPLSQP